MIKSKKSQNLGAEWKKWRQDRLMTQADLARILGCWRETVSRAEEGVSVPSYALQAKMRALMKTHEKEKQNEPRFR